MVRFLIFFFSLYAAMHVFVLSRARVLLPQAWPGRLLISLFIILMMLAPVGIRALERSGHDDAARVLGHVGYIWMAFIFLCFSGYFASAVLELVYRLASFVFPLNPPSFTGIAPTLFVIALSTSALAYGYFEALNIRVERVTIRTAKLAREKGPLKIAQISDVHLGIMVRGERLRRITEKVKREDPDIVVSTGDLVDGNIGHLDDLSSLFRELSPRYGKYAVMGNHEFYAGLSESLDFLERAGFEPLRDRAVTIEGVINITGVDDSVVSTAAREKMVLSKVQNGLFTLHLKHRPQVSEEARGLFDLQLSGHAHRGQIFPFNYVVRFVYPMLNGLHHLGDGSMLYVSRGSGTWGPPMRVLAPPEVTLIELIPEGQAKEH